MILFTPQWFVLKNPLDTLDIHLFCSVSSSNKKNNLYVIHVCHTLLTYLLTYYTNNKQQTTRWNK